MKNFKITSPCYRANGLNGTYTSIVITEDNGNIVEIFGDHFFSGNVIHVVEREHNNPITNIYEAEGLNYSDDFRPISIQPIKLDVDFLTIWREGIRNQEVEIEKWESKKTERFGSLMDFIYKNRATKKQQEDRWEEYFEWKKQNPSPKRSFDYYDFLKAIKDVD